ncbi:MAG: hypothetical protein OXC62_15455 [Aestuariivita sp.]|nr:hypothetical protein [Aestuariivita sp.]
MTIFHKMITVYTRLDAMVQAKTSGTAAGGGALSGEPARGLALLQRKLTFLAATRAEIWQLLSDVVEAGVSLDEAIETLMNGYCRSGHRTKALVLAEMRVGLLDNNISVRLAPYVSAPERLIFDGLGEQEAHVVFGSAARLLKNRLALRKALNEAIAMPILLTVGLFALILFFGLELLPALSEIVDFSTLPTLQAITVQFTLAISRYPTALGIGVMGFIAFLSVLMRVWTGPGRVTADRFPPFSVMRLQAGTGFLFAIIEYGRNGTAVTTTLLERMAQVTGRYEASRIRAMIPSLEKTGNLGTAALDAHQGFPNDDVAVVLQVLWNRDDGISRAGLFLERRLDQIESNVRARMAVLNAVLLTLVTTVLVLLLSVMMPIFDQLNQGAL